MFQVGSSSNTFPTDPSQGHGRRFLRNQHNKRRIYQRLGIKVSGCEGLCSGSSWRNDLGVKTARSSAGLYWQVFKRWRPELRIQKDNSVPIIRVCCVNVHFLIVSMIVETVSPCVCQQSLQPVIPLPRRPVLGLRAGAAASGPSPHYPGSRNRRWPGLHEQM